MPELKPFTPVPDLVVRADIEHLSTRLRFNFEIQSASVVGGPTPGRWTTWERGDELWRSTCFEAFLRLPNQAGYWELNVSPQQRAWNLYHFNAYREPQLPTPVANFELGPIAMTATRLSCELNLPAPWPTFEINLCAVIVTRDQVSHYFALGHPGPKPDFHAAAGFGLTVAAGGV